MNSSRPYLLRAIYEWLIDNSLTPYIMVDAMASGVEVPERFVEDGKIVLNIESQAVGNLRLGNDAVEFDARFSGIAHHIFIPVSAVKAIYAFENGRGMVFSDEDGDDEGGGDLPPSGTTKPPVKKGRPNLKVVK
ncbi:ClpXP protease specificity-enhancing factor [Candidiatus Paracoxiella cheracis]|uniref:ClpXP protease specificity-enhancing factor n=1 Tax=Candidiatus Paracoxiella cheracis TaxID=3405120 RepID=UPI003BF5C65A